MSKPSPHYSVAKCRQILRHVNTAYQKKYTRLSDGIQKEIEQSLERLDNALRDNDAEKIQAYAHEAESFGQTYLSKNIIDHIRELFGALLFALIVATLIRQLWFEPYEIPTGSMRPTLKEEDRLLVTKTQFGINKLLQLGHYWFDESAVKRNGIFVFTVEGMEIADPDTTYFWFFPGKKLLIKRCLAKPGDTLYFYGGQIYGIDREGHPLEELFNAPGLEKIDHVPFMTFEGKVKTRRLTASQGYEIQINQMNMPVGRYLLEPNQPVTAEVFNGSEWVTDTPSPLPPSTLSGIRSYSDLWGFGNFAMTRLLTRDEALLYAPQLVRGLPSADLYLELRHHGDLTYPSPHLAILNDGQGAVEITPQVSMIPLEASHIEALEKNLYTARFGVQNGYMYRYNSDGSRSAPTAFSPRLPGLPEGVYEFYYGDAYQISWGGISKELPQDHPLYAFNPYRLQLFFNLGLDFHTRFAPNAKGGALHPQRFAYFRDGDLYVMGGPIFKKGDPLLESFLSAEKAKAAASAASKPYQPFIDQGAPLKEDGTWDIDFIRAFGVHIPEGYYLALGDNYAMSGDSRDFGFVPETNIKGVPTFIVWPPGNRWGSPIQAAYPILVPSRLVIWVVAGLILGVSLSWQRYRRSRRVILFKHKNSGK